MDTVTALRRWAQFLSQIRRFFDDRGFTEVTTPHMVPAGAFEAAIDTVATQCSQGRAELHTSPEIEMKRLLAKAPISTYQICRCFRDDPLETGIHGKEFTMLEFYAVGEDYAGIRKLMHALLAELGYDGQVPERTVEELLAGKNPAPLAGERWEDAFFKIFLQEVERKLPLDPPTLVKDYPAALAALAALSPDGKTAQRFEIFWKGMEICNGCVELAHLGELEARAKTEAEARLQNGKAAHPLPERLLEAVRSGIPPCAGVAVGLDRLFKCLTGEFGPAFR